MYTNANSLGNKQDEMKCRVQQDDVDIIGLTEIWQKEVFAIQGYHPAFRRDRPENQVGGGVMLLVRDCWSVSECTELNEMCFEESVWCTLKLSDARKLLVGVCYRSPASTSENNEKLLKLLQQARKTQATHLLIMGDFNYGQVDWDTGFVPGPENSDAMKFYEKTQDLLLYQYVDMPTRYREGCHPSMLDLVFSTEELMVDNLVASSPLGKSDHVLLTWDFIYANENVDDEKCVQKSRFNYKGGTI